MLKITPATISGKLFPASLDKSLFSALALASLSGSEAEIRYKGFSDEAMCVVNALEKTGALISISKDRIAVTPTNVFPEAVYLDFCESDKALFMLLPFLKRFISTVNASHNVISGSLADFCSVLEAGGCRVQQSSMTLHVSGRFSSPPTATIKSSDFSDGLALCGFNKPSAVLKKPVDFFKSRKKSPFVVDADPLYLSYFVMASSFIDCECDVPNPLKPFVITEFKNGTYRHTPRLEAFRADASALGEYLLPCVLLAMRMGKTCNFENYLSPKGFHARLMQMLSDLNISHRISKHTLTVNSEAGVSCEKIRAWNDERFIITACLASSFSDKESVLDSERAIIRKYPTFFDDFRELGGIYQKL